MPEVWYGRSGIVVFNFSFNLIYLFSESGVVFPDFKSSRVILLDSFLAKVH